METKDCVVVVGAGLMGTGIAHAFASSGHPVTLVDTQSQALARARQTIEKILADGVRLGKSTQDDAAAALERLHSATALDAAPRQAALVIETATEKMDIKQAIVREAESLFGEDTVIATNTSALSITEIASVARRPAQVIGMHFFNPVPIMALVEVIKGLATCAETTQRTIDLAIAMGKTPVPANDRAGFVSNRVLMPMINEAFHAWMEGVAKPEDIDQIMKLGCNFPMGPLRLADFIGLDVCHDIMMVLYRELGDQKFFPCPMLRQLVQAGRLGDKSGRGVFDYSKK